ncbi:MAG: ribosome maturation factor RimP [Lapillicoccus sp.]
MGADIVTALATPLAELGLVAVDATVGPAGSRRILRVLVDRDVSGLDATDPSSRVAPLTLDEVADATGVVGRALDDGGLMGERPYTLEVSSPGVGRPMAGYAAFRRNVGRLVTMTLTSGETVTARLLAVTPDELTVEVPAERKRAAERRAVPLGQVRSGVVQVEFGRVDDGVPTPGGDAAEDAGVEEDETEEDEIDEDETDEEEKD